MTCPYLPPNLLHREQQWKSHMPPSTTTNTTTSTHAAKTIPTGECLAENLTRRLVPAGHNLVFDCVCDKVLWGTWVEILHVVQLQLPRVSGPDCCILCAPRAARGSAVPLPHSVGAICSSRCFLVVSALLLEHCSAGCWFQSCVCSSHA